MENYLDPLMPEELMASYLDGTLSDEDTKIFENLIFENPELEDILYDLDLADANYIQDPNPEIPLECLADDFTLPGWSNQPTSDNFIFHDDFQGIELDMEESDNFEDSQDWDQEETSNDNFNEEDDFFPEDY